ncbi:MAG: hypothetical protein ACSHX9_02045 [Luteolibacter sp.]
MTANEADTKATETKRNEWKVLIVLALSLLVMEVLVRNFAGSLSVDLRNTLITPESASRIARADDADCKVLVVGNSLARCGVDLKLLGQNSDWLPNSEGAHVRAELFAPDSSSVIQWSWGLKRYFQNTGSYPDTILLFTGRTHLLDVRTMPETLGAYYVGTRDLGEAYNSMRDSEESLRVLLGAGSHLLANRDRIRPRIGYSYLPGFLTAWPTLTVGAGNGDDVKEEQPQEAGTESLERLIATARKMNSKLHVISVPLPEPYQIPDEVLRLLAETDTPFHDLSTLPGITPSQFPDGYHLDEAGSAIFTRAILDALRRDLPSSQ